MLPGLGEHLPQRAPEPERAVTDGQHRGAHAAAFAVTQQVGPRAGRLAVAIGQGDELLHTVDPYPDHDEQAQLLFVQAHVEVDSVGPQVNIVHTGQIPVGEAVGVVLPLRGQPGDRRRGQAGVGAEDRAGLPPRSATAHCGLTTVPKPTPQ